MAIDPASAEQVAGALLEYLSTALRAGEIRFAEPPERVGRGLDTHIYAFRLVGEGLDPAWTGPLVLRLYPTSNQGAKAEREGEVQRFAAEHGYPALVPLALETRAEPFGLPLMLMERVDGAPMLELMGRSPLTIPGLLRKMGALHVALHRLPLGGCPLSADGPLVERRLVEFRERIERSAVRGLDDALGWLERHKAIVTSEQPALLHNDFHPLNILIDRRGRATVLDWSDAMVGDRHHDIGRTVGVFNVAWIAAGSALERRALRPGGGWLANRYLAAYRRHVPIDRDRLRYWEALQAFHGWLQLRELEDPAFRTEVGARSDSIESLPEGFAAFMERYFWRRARW